MSDEFKFSARANDPDRRAEAVGAALRLVHAGLGCPEPVANRIAHDILKNLGDYADKIEGALELRSGD